MKPFTTYLGAARYAREHNMSLASIEKIGHSKWTVFIKDEYIIVPAPTQRPMPQLPRS
jgi:urate oxidase